MIAFRDYGVDSEPMLESKFFTLDGESGAFHEFVEGIEATGGGDEPESSLEALALAMKSDWVRTGSVRRHVHGCIGFAFGCESRTDWLSFRYAERLGRIEGMVGRTVYGKTRKAFTRVRSRRYALV